MVLTAEISLYPLRDDYIAAIDGFIAELNQHGELRVNTTPTSTCVVGEHGAVMQALSAAVRNSAERFGTSAIVVKLLPGYDGSPGGATP